MSGEVAGCAALPAWLCFLLPQVGPGPQRWCVSQDDRDRCQGSWMIQLDSNLVSAHSSPPSRDLGPTLESGWSLPPWELQLSSSCYLTPLLGRGTQLVRTKLKSCTFASNMSLDPDAGGLASRAPPSALSFPLSFFSIIDFGGLRGSYTWPSCDPPRPTVQQ